MPQTAPLNEKSPPTKLGSKAAGGGKVINLMIWRLVGYFKSSLGSNTLTALDAGAH